MCIGYNEGVGGAAMKQDKSWHEDDELWEVWDSLMFQPERVAVAIIQ